MQKITPALQVILDVASLVIQDVASLVIQALSMQPI